MCRAGPVSAPLVAARSAQHWTGAATVTRHGVSDYRPAAFVAVETRFYTVRRAVDAHVRTGATTERSLVAVRQFQHEALIDHFAPAARSRARRPVVVDGLAGQSCTVANRQAIFCI